ncbi:MAG TPA: 3-isopropylmalate dehydratase large subunit, partial [Stellaceae bacterium]|nr:3-isopropylmalate dehydratase large subunit [Stellaceae bacterium]
MPTLFDKIWDQHYVGQRADGRALIFQDRHVVHDLHAPPAFERLAQLGRSVRRPDLTICVTDHMVSTSAGRTKASNEAGEPFLHATEAAGAEHGIRVLGLGDPMQGIVHVVSPELGLALPGSTLACPDSHACTVGGIGCLGFATGTTELVHVLATQMLALKKPKQMRVMLNGKLGPGVTAKDVILYLIGRYGSSAAKGYAVEFAGPVVRAMPVEGRLTLCNMTTEFGGRTALMAPDEVVFDWLIGRPAAPKGAEWDAALAEWRELRSDDDAVFDVEHVVDCDVIEPQITWGTDPAHVVSVAGRVPDPATLDPSQREVISGALDYMGLTPGMAVEGLPVNRVFIGSCTNARLSDLEAAASIAKGRKVAAGVIATVVPGSSSVKRAAEALGLDRIFLDAGFSWGEAGCSLCAGVNGEEGKPGQRIVSTTNRNFAGRQGKGVKTHLASPATAAAAAIAGHIADPR